MISGRPHARRSLLSGLLLVLSVLSISTPTSAQEERAHWPGQSAVRISLGQFSPDGDSTYWTEKEIDFTASTDEFDDVSLSVDYLYYWDERFAALISMGGWEGKQTQSYRDFVDGNGREIAHLTTVQEVWLDVGVIFHLFDERQVVMPYVGAGGSVIFWELTEEGEFIDFDTTPFSVFNDAFFADGDAFGYFLLVGLEIPVSERITLFGEARWRSAEDELGADFAGFGELDLSGRSISGGLSFHF